MLRSGRRLSATVAELMTVHFKRLGLVGSHPAGTGQAGASGMTWSPMLLRWAPQCLFSWRLLLYMRIGILSSVAEIPREFWAGFCRVVQSEAPALDVHPL